MAQSNPRRLFLAPTSGEAKCQVPGVPACPGLGRAGRWALKGPRLVFHAGGVWPRRTGNSVRSVAGGPLSIHPAPAPPVCPFPSPVPHVGSWRQPEGQAVTAAAPRLRSPRACVCWPRGHRGRSLWRPILVRIPPNPGPARRTRPAEKNGTKDEDRAHAAQDRGSGSRLGARGSSATWRASGDPPADEARGVVSGRFVPAPLPLQGFCSVLFRPL